MDGWCNLVAGAGMRDVGSSPIPSTLLILLKKVSTHLFTRGRATVKLFVKTSDIDSFE